MSEKFVRGPYPEPTLDALIARHAKEDPDRTFLDFLVDGEPTGPIDRLTFLELERRVAAVAAHLSAAAAVGDRAVLLYDAGRSFVVAFFAAMRAGLIPVPAFPPNPANLSRSLPRLFAIVSDAQPTLVLSTTFIADIAKGFAGGIPELSGIRWIGTDALETGTIGRDCNRDLRPDSVAFLQYTSGSTRAPRGVIVSHANLMANAHAIDQVVGKGVRPKVMVGWLPMFHDNGLIGHIIYPLCAGFSSVIMSPLHFLQRPGRWIEALSRFGGHVTGAPNFGYELCTRRASTVLSSDVDLSRLEVAYCGAEPVRAETLDRFAAQFSRFGFSPKAFLPAYGLAEATLVVSTGPAGLGYRQKSVIARSSQGRGLPAAARREHERRVVSCGEPLIETKVVVVDPEQRVPLAPGEVGEIWVKNDAVASGYWRRENQQDTFGATTLDGDGPFLRTGDLGALVDGELCVTGRLKDLLIIAGRNYYPQDIEYVVEKHPAVRTGCVAAFTVERTGSEVLVVAAEVSKALLPEGDVGESGALRSVIEELIRAVVDECQVSPVDVVLLKPGDAPKTSSGKIQRHRAREAYLSGSLDAIASALQLGLGATGDPWAPQDGTEPQTLSAWLTATVARTLGRSVNADMDLIDAGMTSLAILDVMEALRRRTSREIPNEAFWRCRSIAKLVQFVEEEPLQAAVADEPIVVVPDPDRLNEAFPLNAIQNAYWLGRQDAYELGQVACHYYVEFDCKGLDPARVNAAWNAVVRRHPMLRAVVLPDGRQRVLPQVPEYHGEEEDLSRLEPAAKDRRLAEVRDLLSHRVPDAARWPLLEFRLLRVDSETWRMCLSVDLLVADVWSLLIMGQDWARVYHGEALDEPAPQLSFRDCVIAEDRLRSTAQYRRAWQYWEDRARSLPPGPKLPVVRPSSAGDRPRFERLAGHLDRATWNRLKGMAAKAGLSPTGFVAAAFTEVLAEWCDTPAFTLNLTLFNRPAFHEQINKIVGDFTTLLLLETPGWQGLPTFRTRARKLQTQLWQDLEHRAVNGIDVLAHINQSRGDKKPLRVPVVLTSAIGMADLTGTDVAGINWPGQRVFSVSQTPQVWLDHQVSDWSGSLEYSWDVVTDIFPVGLPETMFDAYQKLLLRLADEAAWEDPDLSPAGQSHWDAWAAYNDTKAEQPGGLLHEPVLERAREQPTRPAVLSTRRCLTYGELQHWTETIAETLRRLGVGSGSPVGVLMHHGWEQIPATIGILAAGGAYVPIDAALPENRIRSLLAISETKVVLSQSWARGFAWPDGVARVDVDLLEPGRDSPRPSAPPALPSDLAYVIFTSGSTGEPKGVMIEHRSALNTVRDINRRFDITADDRVLGVSRLSFDLSVWDIFGALAAGAALVVPEEDQRAEPQALLDLMRRYRVTVWNSAPPLMEMLSNYAKGTPDLPNDLRLAMLSGDWIPLHLPPALKDLFPAVDVISLGGATEGSIWSIAYPIGQLDLDWKSVPYGRPLSNQAMHVFDENLRPRPVWAAGEIYIGGAGVARGYWNDPALTAAKFVTDPRTKETLFRTGDLGRLLPSGEMEFLGRIDLQEKIRGHRIELREIESVLRSLPGVLDSVVLARSSRTGHKELHAYIIPCLEVDRVATDIRAVVRDEAGDETPVLVNNLSAGGAQLADCPAAWVPGTRLTLTLSLPDRLDEQVLESRPGVVVFRRNELAGLRFDVRDDAGRLREAVHLLAQRSGIDAAEGFRLRSIDGRRRHFRVPIGQSCEARKGDHEQTVVLRDLSTAGVGIDGVPAHWGQSGEISLTILDTGIRVRGEICWRKDNRIGAILHVPAVDEGLLRSFVAGLIKDEGCAVPEVLLRNLRRRLRVTLPHYMVPTRFEVLHELPLTANGKVDRDALPEIQRETPRSDRPPTTNTEKVITELWCEALDLDPDDVGIDESFFQVGGDSVLAVDLLVGVRQQLAVDVPLRSFYEDPTIGGISRCADRLLGRAAALHVAGAARDAGAEPEDAFGRWGRPGMLKRLRALRLDKHYVRAKGNHATYLAGSEEVTVLDLVGGFGATLLGHNPDPLVEHLQALLRADPPNLVQVANNVEAGSLAEVLSRTVSRYTKRSYFTTFASTGSEAVEAAVKHAKLYRRNDTARRQRDMLAFAALVKNWIASGKVKLDERLFETAAEGFQYSGEEHFDDLVEAMVKHNEAVTGAEPVFLSLDDAFHGMTAGALSLTATRAYRDPFHWMGIKSRLVPQDGAALERVARDAKGRLFSLSVTQDGWVKLRWDDWCGIGALFVEPIQGESGVIPVGRAFATEAREIADRFGFPIVVDEIQCGMGRTGTFCAAEQIGLRGDCYLFSKSLGGGLAKISALLIDSAVYQEDFGYYHQSTFAEDRISTKVALKTLELLESQRAAATARVKGAAFLAKLATLKDRFPELVADVRGLGLMIGIEFIPPNGSASFFLRAMAQSGPETISRLVAAYLLNVKRIRVAPGLSRSTVRILPSIQITESEMDAVVAGLAEVLDVLQKANAGRFLRFIVDGEGEPPGPVSDWRLRHPRRSDEDVAATDVAVAHVGYAEDDETLLAVDPSLAELETEQRRNDLLRRLLTVAVPAVVERHRISSRDGRTVHLTLLGLPLTGSVVEELLDSGRANDFVELIEQAVDWGRSHRCRVVGLGERTSGATLNGTTCGAPDIVVTTGNGYTAALAMQGVREAAEAAGLRLERVTGGVVGATGNIGSVCARMLAKQCARIVLFGHRRADQRAQRLAAELYREALDELAKGGPLSGIARTIAALPELDRCLATQEGAGEEDAAWLYHAFQRHYGSEAPVSISTELHEVRRCQAVVSATAVAGAVLKPEHFSNETTVVCDVSTPPDVSKEVPRERPNVTVYRAGNAMLRSGRGVRLIGTALPEDHLPGCVSETIALCFSSDARRLASIGDLTLAKVEAISKLAQEIGFELGQSRSLEP